MDDVIGIILLIVTIIVSLPVVGMMLLFAIFMDYGIEDKKENIVNPGDGALAGDIRSEYQCAESRHGCGA